jgi:hypothetical protein
VSDSNAPSVVKRSDLKGNETDERTDLRTIFPHGSWREVYALVEAPTSIEPEGRL